MTEFSPLWVISELFTFGMISYFYADLITQDQKKLSHKLYETIPKNLISWLRCVTDLRKICAHHGRLSITEFSQLSQQVYSLNELEKRTLSGF